MKGSYPPLMSYVHGFTHLFSYCDGLIENSTWGPRRATILRFVSPVPQLRSWPIGSPVYWHLAGFRDEAACLKLLADKIRRMLPSAYQDFRSGSVPQRGWQTLDLLH